MSNPSSQHMSALISDNVRLVCDLEDLASWLDRRADELALAGRLGDEECRRLCLDLHRRADEVRQKVLESKERS